MYQRTHHSTVTIISQNLNRFSQFFHCWKVCEIGNKTVYRNMCFHCWCCEVSMATGI